MKYKNRSRKRAFNFTQNELPILWVNGEKLRLQMLERNEDYAFLVIRKHAPNPL